MQSYEELNDFFKSRPSLSKRGICKESGISNSLLDYIIIGKRRLTEEVEEKLYPVLNKYGGKFNLNKN